MRPWPSRSPCGSSPTRPASATAPRSPRPSTSSPPPQARPPPTSPSATRVTDPQAERYAALVASGHAARITYYSASRDTTSERVVDPIEVVAADGHAYLRAWCRTAGEIRQFRIDRIDACSELDEPSEPLRLTNQPAPTAFLASELPRIQLLLGPGATAVTDAYPCDEVIGESDGRRRVTMRVRDLDWARRFVLGLGGEAEVLAPDRTARRRPTRPPAPRLDRYQAA